MEEPGVNTAPPAGEVIETTGAPVPDPVLVGLADGDEDAEAEADGDGLVVEDWLQVTPFRVNVVGLVFVPLKEKFAPICVDWLVPREPFQLAFATVTFAPDWDQVPDQPWVSAWLPE
jgi:hypothetical protein